MAVLGIKSPKKTIMVVDDEEDNRTTVKSILEANGYSVITAVDGDDCLKKLNGKTVQLILMDIMMPGTPVREVVAQVGGKAKIAFLSVVRMSDVEKGHLLKMKGVVGFIQKPFDVDALLSEVRRVV